MLSLNTGHARVKARALRNLLFSFECCTPLSVFRRNLEVALDSLLFSFECCWDVDCVGVFEAAWRNSCYFLLNVVVLKIPWPKEIIKTEQLAIFFWMLFAYYVCKLGKSPWQCHLLFSFECCSASRTAATFTLKSILSCYFLLNVVNLVSFSYHAEELVLDLLFSFECCRRGLAVAVDQTMNRQKKSCYFLLNVVRPQ